MSDQRSVEIVEVGPRDGLQSEPGSMATFRQDRVHQRLIDAGLRIASRSRAS
ncbi:MAG: hypothetical protein U1F11_12060 [Steroidobacteraceae bacterium]